MSEPGPVRLVGAGFTVVVLLVAGAGPAASWAQPVTCQGEPATIVGTAGDDTLDGTPGDDVVAGLGGDDIVTGGGGDDLVCGGAGTDLVTAGAGADRLHGGRGDDEVHDVVVDSDDQALVGGPGRDALLLGWRVSDGGEEVPVRMLTDFARGTAVVGDTGAAFPARSFHRVEARFSEGTWAVVGTPGPDHYVAHQYMSVHARTGAGRDVVEGSWHDDVISGGRGRDTAYADRGRDTCHSVERGPLGECEYVS